MVLAIFQAIAAVPQVLGYLEKFGAWVTTQCDAIRQAQLAKDAQAAAAAAQATKDPENLDHLFDPSKADGKKSDVH